MEFVTANGSTVKVEGVHNGIITIDFDWFEEDRACIDCEVDIEASRDSGWTKLIWGCCECTGGQASLTPVQSDQRTDP